MQGIRYTAEFKAEAIKQITERGHGVVEVAKRLGISDKSLNAWLKKAVTMNSQIQKISLYSNKSYNVLELNSSAPLKGEIWTSPNHRSFSIVHSLNSSRIDSALKPFSAIS